MVTHGSCVAKAGGRPSPRGEYPNSLKLSFFRKNTPKGYFAAKTGILIYL